MKAILITQSATKRTDLTPDGQGSILTELQHHVHGYVEPFALTHTITLWVNEDGIGTLPPNRLITATRETRDMGYVGPRAPHRAAEPGEPITLLFGDIVATGRTPDGDTRGLTDREAEYVERYFTEDSPAGSGAAEATRIRYGM